MKILFISTKGPLPTNDGHCLRTYNLLNQIAQQHEVHLLSFVKYEEEYDYIPKLKELCSSVKYLPLRENYSGLENYLSLARSVLTSKPYVFYKYDKPEMRAAIQQVLAINKIDLIHLDMLPLYCYQDLIGHLPTLLNQHNIESALLKRRVETEPIWRKWFFSKQQRCLEKYEKQAMEGVDAVAVCSESDQLLAQRMAPGILTEVVTNGVDTDFFQSSGQRAEEPFSLVFVGGLNWYPNLEGLEWFDREVMPLIVDEYPQLKIHLIGRQVTVNWRHHENFQVHGFVDDIRPYLESASLFIVPLRIGGGTRLKILDALSMGKAVLSTSIGAEGLQTIDGDQLILADSAADFAAKIISLCNDYSKRQALSQKGREFVVRKYRWEAIGLYLCQLYEQILLKDDGL